jgi:acyl-coenzyme A synthetase/AMP-(fatty) acid ligase
MPSAHGAPPTLLGLFQSVPSQQTAIIVPEHDIRVSYGRLRDQVEAFAEALVGAGIRRGDRPSWSWASGLASQ